MSEHSGNEAAAAEAKPAGGEAAVAAAAAKGGMGAWMPLIVTLVAMPALAFAATKFLIVPQLQKAVAQAAPGATPAAAAPAAAAHGAAPAAAHGEKAAAKESSGHGGGGGHGGAASEKPGYALNKLIVNVAGTMGTRYLLTSMTLIGTSAEFKTKAEERRDQLVDVAGTALSHKTIAELEKPGARTQIRSELLTVFNEVLGEGEIKEIYFTEFNIQ